MRIVYSILYIIVFLHLLWQTSFVWISGWASRRAHMECWMRWTTNRQSQYVINYNKNVYTTHIHTCMYTMCVCTKVLPPLLSLIYMYEATWAFSYTPYSLILLRQKWANTNKNIIVVIWTNNNTHTHIQAYAHYINIFWGYIKIYWLMSTHLGDWNGNSAP